MYNPNLTLEELFKPNSLRNLRTEKQAPMPHRAPTYYVSCYHAETDIREHLEHGNKFVPGGFSINSYITLSEKAHELISPRLIELGPGEPQSSSCKIEFIQYSDNPEKILISASGWGSSVIRLYEGSSEVFLNYLKKNQKRD